MPEGIKKICVRTGDMPRDKWREVQEAEIRIEFDNGHLELTIKKKRRR